MKPGKCADALGRAEFSLDTGVDSSDIGGRERDRQITEVKKAEAVSEIAAVASRAWGVFEPAAYRFRSAQMGAEGTPPGLTGAERPVAIPD